MNHHDKGNGDAGGDILSNLFETKAIEVCPPGKPFFYTSGKLGPYYINTHYLYGSKTEAEQFLAFLEKGMADPIGLPAALAAETMRQYRENPIYRSVIGMIASKASGLAFDFISGGERRDFFFSIPIAVLLQKPHLSIYKDLSVTYSDDSFTSNFPEGRFSIEGLRGLHIADLVTEASSYTRAWLPATGRLGAVMAHSISVIDRRQGGGGILRQHGVGYEALADITEDLFSRARDSGYLSDGQFDLIRSFIQDPDRFMLDFFQAHPTFLDDQIALGGKARERALRCIENGYHLPGRNT